MSDMGEGEGEDEMSNKTRTRNTTCMYSPLISLILSCIDISLNPGILFIKLMAALILDSCASVACLTIGCL